MCDVCMNELFTVYFILFRPSGERLKQTLIDGMNLLGTKYIDFGS